MSIVRNVFLNDGNGNPIESRSGALDIHAKDPLGDELIHCAVMSDRADIIEILYK